MPVVRFTPEHEWIRIEAGVGTVGITDYAQQQLGDVVFVELPAIGTNIAQGEQMAVVESVKAASEVYAPAAGEVVAVNDALADEPGDVNAEPMGKGWFAQIRLRDESELQSLMDEDAYQAFVGTLS